MGFLCASCDMNVLSIVIIISIKKITLFDKPVSNCAVMAKIFCTVLLKIVSSSHHLKFESALIMNFFTVDYLLFLYTHTELLGNQYLV